MGELRELGPDIPRFRLACAFLWAHIDRLEKEIDALRIALIQYQENAGEGE